jgi:hypothetical protein
MESAKQKVESAKQAFLQALRDTGHTMNIVPYEPKPFVARAVVPWFEGRTIDPSLGDYWVDPVNLGEGPFTQLKTMKEVKALIGNSTRFSVYQTCSLGESIPRG